MAHHVLRIAAGSDIGRRRRVNEDSALAGPRLLAVADGMGGHPHGDVASRTAVATLAGLPLSGDLVAVLSAGVTEVAARLDALARQNPDLAGMGTTLTALAWDEPGRRFAVAHIGDSRAYVLRGGDLFQLTRDHTMVQSLVDGGQLTRAEAARHPKGSMLVRALQSGGSAQPDLFWHDALPGDRYLLCSDGVSGFLTPEAIRDALADAARPADGVASLIGLANGAGGQDNITCVVADVAGAEPAPGPAPEPLLVGAAAQDGAGRIARFGRRLRRTH
ncbi:serine/threonine-protein phosphatase [Actinomadura spongiicola]|uniref:Serine/threonine-protein phosphatase n=1 Tax=Actinomadura spongiicola TaxID=2303421 RepID=A0A372GB69_9ACTN|nr:protein phosphatase 2C domain-containing protein [Actinomadura spongiicola]RFS82587.1 serine/threonine-protein phosphatase [Actinomadura spongiicola]